jgi:hypothetical protein
MVVSHETRPRLRSRRRREDDIKMGHRKTLYGHGNGIRGMPSGGTVPYQPDLPDSLQYQLLTDDGASGTQRVHFLRFPSC